MSRYSLKPLPQRADVFEVAVGWDAGFGTFFVIVFGSCKEGHDPELKTWEGARPGQIPTLLHLRHLIKQYADLDPELLSRLQADHRAEAGQLAIPLSDFIFRLL
jgi:hypothetical protein